MNGFDTCTEGCKRAAVALIIREAILFSFPFISFGLHCELVRGEKKSGDGGHIPLIQAPVKQRQPDLCEFKAAWSRIPRVPRLHRETLPQKNKQGNKNKKNQIVNRN